MESAEEIEVLGRICKSNWGESGVQTASAGGSGGSGDLQGDQGSRCRMWGVGGVQKGLVGAHGVLMGT